MEAERMSVDEMEAGEALDALVAEKVMGDTVEWYRPPGHEDLPERPMVPWEGVGYGRTAVPRYSTVIADAWQVVAEMERRGRWIGLMQYRDGIRVVFSSTQNKAPLHPEATADTTPHAICLAALKAVGVTTVERARKAGL